MNSSRPRSSSTPERSTVLRWLLYVCLVLFMGNLGAMTDLVLHPDISYFDEEHLIAGGITAMVMFILLGALEVYLVRRRQMEAARQEAEERYHGLVESAFDGSVIHQDGIVVEANAAYAKMFGYTAEELPGKPALEFFASEVRPTVAMIFRRQEPAPYESVGLRKDGSRFAIETAGKTCTFRGRPARIAAVRDISERKQAEAELRKLSLAVNDSDEAIFMTDLEGVIRFVNPAFTRLYGHAAADVVGKVTPRILKSGALPREAYESFWKVILSRQVVKGELTNKTRDGRLLPIESSANPILDEHGERIGFLAIQRDITERKQAEAALLEKNAELNAALANIKTLSGMLPICSGCNKIRDDKNYWHSVERYIMKHTEATFTHGLCPECVRKYYPDYCGHLPSE